MENESQMKELAFLLRRNLVAHRWYNVLFRGVLGGIGGTIGLAILISLAYYILNELQYLPYIGDFFENIKSLIENRPRL